MKTKTQPVATKVAVKPRFPMTSEERGKAAVTAMHKELVEEYRRWNMPFITWKDGKVVEDWSWKDEPVEDNLESDGNR